jgi:hypothetical protein
MTALKTSGSRSFTIVGKAYWAKVQKPDEYAKYTLDLTVDDESKATLKNLGITWNNKGDEKGDYIQPWMYSAKKDGTPLKCKVFDKDGAPFEKLIGNGSTVAVSFFPKEWTYMKKTGVRAALLSIKIIDLVEYRGEPEVINPNYGTSTKTSAPAQAGSTKAPKQTAYEDEVA